MKRWIGIFTIATLMATITGMAQTPSPKPGPDVKKLAAMGGGMDL